MSTSTPPWSSRLRMAGSVPLNWNSYVLMTSSPPWITELVDNLRAATWMNHARIYLTGSSMADMSTWKIGASGSAPSSSSSPCYAVKCCYAFEEDAKAWPHTYTERRPVLVEFGELSHSELRSGAAGKACSRTSSARLMRAPGKRCFARCGRTWRTSTS